MWYNIGRGEEMPNQTAKTKMVAFRMEIGDYERIKALITSQWNNGNTSVGDYCKTVVARWLRRHDKKMCVPTSGTPEEGTHMGV